MRKMNPTGDQGYRIIEFSAVPWEHRHLRHLTCGTSPAASGCGTRAATQGRNWVRYPSVELACSHVYICVWGVSVKGDPQESVFVLSCTYLAIRAAPSRRPPLCPPSFCLRDSAVGFFHLASWRSGVFTEMGEGAPQPARRTGLVSSSDTARSSRQTSPTEHPGPLLAVRGCGLTAAAADGERQCKQQNQKSCGLPHLCLRAPIIESRQHGT